MQSPSVDMLQILIMMLHTSLNLSTLLKPWRIIVQFGSSCAELQLKIHYTNPGFVWMLNVGEQLGKIFIVKASGSVEEEEVLLCVQPNLAIWKQSQIADSLKTIWNCRQSKNYLKFSDNLKTMWSCRQSSWRNGCVCFWVWGFWDWLSSEEQTTTWY